MSPRGTRALIRAASALGIGLITALPAALPAAAELAFFSWFYDQSPSLGVHGWYSDQATFKMFSSPCS